MESVGRAGAVNNMACLATLPCRASECPHAYDTMIRNREASAELGIVFLIGIS